MRSNQQLFSEYRYIFFFSVDRTRNGHIIGSVEAQSSSLTSERNLTPLACGIVRFLTHGAMLLGADQNCQVCWIFQISVIPFYLLIGKFKSCQESQALLELKLHLVHLNSSRCTFCWMASVTKITFLRFLSSKPQLL